MQYLSFFVIVVLVGILLQIGKSVLKKILGHTRFRKMFTSRPHPIMIHLHQEVEDLKRTTLQITKDWAEMNQLIQGVGEQQNHFVLDLEKDLNTMRDSLASSLASRLHEQRLHAELRGEVLSRTVGAMAKEMADMRGVMSKKMLALAAKKTVSVEEWTQTEARKRQRDSKGSVLNDHETIKTLVVAIKHALMEFLKDAQKNLSRERAEMMENVRVIFAQLSDDREDIKASISGAFGASSQQTLRCFEQLGLFGRDAVTCIMAMSDHADQSTATRFQELASKLKDVLRSLRVVDINVSSVKGTLDNIDSQFDDIYRKLETGQQSSSERCSDLANRMASATRDLEDKSYGLEEKHRQVAEILSNVADTLSGNQPLDKTELHAAVKVCVKRTHVVTAILDQFASRVERPMHQVVCQMMFLTDMIEKWMKKNIRGGGQQYNGSGGSLREANVKALMAEQEEDQKSEQEMTEEEEENDDDCTASDVTVSTDVTKFEAEC